MNVPTLPLVLSNIIRTMQHYIYINKDYFPNTNVILFVLMKLKEQEFRGMMCRLNTACT